MWLQKISIPSPRRVIENSEGGRVFNTNNFKGKYGAKLEFPVGCGGSKVQTKKPSMGGVWIFLVQHIAILNEISCLICKI